MEIRGQSCRNLPGSIGSRDAQPVLAGAYIYGCVPHPGSSEVQSMLRTMVAIISPVVVCSNCWATSS